MAQAERPPVSVEEIEAQAARQYVHWDRTLWQEVLAGPARELSEGVLQRQGETEIGRRLVESYLRLAASGIGLGYLFPASAAGRENFFTLAWMQLIPQHLPEVAAPRQAEVLAQCWNVAENLEHAPRWLKVMFMHACRGLTALDALPDLVSQVQRSVLEPPASPLGAGDVERWTWLAAEDARFLPGRMHFVAPTVLCVHSRETEDSLGLWLEDPPRLLGPMGCSEALAEKPAQAPVFDTVENAWRSATTLVTSQFLVTRLPG